MILAEPPPSQGDLHFRIADTPVRIHPFFWITTLVLGLGGQTPPAQVVAWVAVVVVSILVHEFGHTIVQRHFGGRPRIVLHSFGGLAICDDCDRSTRSQILISLAGPMAGFLFAAVVLVAVRLVGHKAGIFIGSSVPLEALGLESAQVLRVVGLTFYWKPFPADIVNYMVLNLLWVNGLWGLVNLLPIYPLDGGQIARELCTLRRPRQGIILSLQISMIAAGVMVLVGLSWRSLLVPIFFAYLAYSSYRTLDAYRASQW